MMKLKIRNNQTGEVAVIETTSWYFTNNNSLKYRADNGDFEEYNFSTKDTTVTQYRGSRQHTENYIKDYLEA